MSVAKQTPRSGPLCVRLAKTLSFQREYNKRTGEDSDPLMLEEMEKAVKELPREARGD